VTDAEGTTAESAERPEAPRVCDGFVDSNEAAESCHRYFV